MFNNLSWQAESLHFSKNSIYMKEVEVCTPYSFFPSRVLLNQPLYTVFCYLAHNSNTNLNGNAMRDRICYIAIYFFNLFFLLIICYTISEISHSWTQSFSCETGLLLDTKLIAGGKGLVYLSSFCLWGELLETWRVLCLVRSRCQSGIICYLGGKRARVGKCFLMSLSQNVLKIPPGCSEPGWEPQQGLPTCVDVWVSQGTEWKLIK